MNESNCTVLTDPTVIQEHRRQAREEFVRLIVNRSGDIYDISPQTLEKWWPGTGVSS